MIGNVRVSGLVSVLGVWISMVSRVKVRVSAVKINF